MSTNPLQGKLLFPFIAPPNGGKGTQTSRLSATYNLPTFDMGATFRAILKEGKDPALAAELNQYMSQGKLVPVQTVLKVFSKGLEELAAKHPGAKGFILDGFPRNVPQADGLVELCKQWGATLAKAIYLNVSMPTVEKRATGRRFCSQDATHVYNLNDPKFAPQNKKLNADGSVAKDAQGHDIWVCDKDGAELITRPDDAPETVKKRLAEYSQETDPLIDKFKKSGQLVEVDGEQQVDKVTKDIVEQAIEPSLGLNPAS